MSLSKRQVAGVLLNAFLLVALFFTEMIFERYSEEFQIKLVAYMGILVLIVSLIIARTVRHKYDCYCILLGLIFIFMFGQHCLYLFGVAPDNMTLLSGRISSGALYDTGFLVLKSILLLNLGYLLTCRIALETAQSKSESMVLENEDTNRVGLYDSGIIFFVVSLVPTLIVLGKNIFLTFTVGYGERMLNSAYRTSGIQNIAGIISGFMVPALLALFIARERGKKWPIFAMIVYLVLYTMSGSRINTMVLLVGTLYIQSNLFTKLNFRKIIKYGALLIVVVLMFSVISTARSNVQESENITQVLKESFDDTVENSIVVSVLQEAGYTFCATATVVDNCPSNESYMYGKSYLSAVAYILPNGLTGNYYGKVGSTDEVFSGYLTLYGSGMGSSFIAEAYWNFGQFSLLLMFVFGLLLGRLSVGIDYAIFRRDFKKIFIYTYVFVTIAFYVRSDTRTFLRNFVWFCLPMVLVASYRIKKILDERRMQAEWKGRNRH